MLIIGHRGACGYEPENTLKSFAKALSLKVDMIELDVQVCKSGELVVFHDKEVSRTTNGFGKISELTLKELKNLDAGNGEKIPTLKEVFDLVDKRTIINIEIKDNKSAQKTIKLIEEYVEKFEWQYNHFQISSFNHIELLKIKNLNSHIKIGALLACLPVDYAQFIKKLEAYSINPSCDFINKEFVDDAQSRGYKVFVWDIKDKDEIEYIKSLGVDGIFLDFPDKFN